MTERRFFSLAAVAPVLLAAAVFVRELADGHSLPGATRARLVADAAAQSAPFLVVLYLAYLAAAHRWVRGRTTAALHLALWMAPIVVALAAALVAAGTALTRGGSEGLPRFLLFYSASLALWGYRLVVPIAALHWLGRRMGVVRPSAAPTA